MDIIAAYREVGTYRGAAAICGTTHKTVKRIVERHEAGGAGRRGRRGHATTTLSRQLVAEKVEETRAGSRRSGCCRRRGRLATTGRPATSAGWSREAEARSGGGRITGPPAGGVDAG